MAEENEKKSDDSEKKVPSADEDVIIEDEYTPDPEPKKEEKPAPSEQAPQPAPSVSSLGGIYVWLIILTLGLAGAYALATVWRLRKEELQAAWKADIEKSAKPAPGDAEKEKSAGAITAGLKKKLADLRRDIAAVRADATDARFDPKPLEDKIAQLRSDIVQLREAGGKEKTSAEELRKKASATLKTLQEQLAALSDDQKKQWEKLNKAQETAAAAGDAAAIAAEMEEIKKKVEGLEAKVTETGRKTSDEIVEKDKTYRDTFALREEVRSAGETWSKSIEEQKQELGALQERLAGLEDKLSQIKPVRITLPTDGTETTERFIVIEAVLIDPNLQDIKKGRLVITSEDSGKAHFTNVEFTNGKTKTTEMLGSGVNVVTLQVESDGKVYSDTIKVTSTAQVSQMRVILNWIGNCDLDLLVTGPSGKMCFYNEKKLPSGALLDRDDRRLGLEPPGPETFLLSTAEGHKLVTGKYKIEVYGFEMRDRSGKKVKKIAEPIIADVTVILHEDDPDRTEVKRYSVKVDTTEKRYPVDTIVLDK